MSTDSEPVNETIHSDNGPLISLEKENIFEEIKIYRMLLKEILHKCKTRKNLLDMYHNYLRRINSFIQLSVIYLSASTTIIQTLTPKSYEVTFEEIPIDNSTDTTTTSNIVDQGTFSQLVPIITLLTTTAGIIVGHMKVEERERNVLNLIERFTEIILRIKYHIDKLEPWNDEEYYSNDNSKIHEWVSFKKTVDKEYTHIVDIKKELFVSYEKLVDSCLYRRYIKKFHIIDKDLYDEISTKLNVGTVKEPSPEPEP